MKGYRPVFADDGGASYGAGAIRIALVALFVSCTLAGGSARVDVLGLIPIRIVAVIALAVVLLVTTGEQAARIRRLLRFPAFVMLLVAIQLIPLPPSVWRALPGHADYARMAEAVVGPVWRPLSMTPDLTINAFLAILPPLAAMLCAELQPRRLLAPMLIVVVATAVGSATLGLAQLAAGTGTVLRHYPITTENAAVGIFANRNHHSVFLACAMPALAAWARMRMEGVQRAGSGRALSALVASGCVGFGAVAIATGSRFGIVGAILGALGAWAIFGIRTGAAAKQMSGRDRLIGIAGAAVLVGGAVLVATLPGSAFQRLLVEGAGDDSRFALLVPIIRMIFAFMPFGSGYGSFDSVYRNFEPFELIRTTYLNAAHDDLAQVLVEGGLAALLLVVAFLIWWSRQIVRVWRRPVRLPEVHAARAASVMTSILLLASLVDYPLRTPLLASLFAVACVWIRQTDGGRKLFTQAG